MKQILTLLILLTLSNLTFGQKIFCANREAYKSNNFSYEFYLFNDSTCYLKGHYSDNAIYFLYEGHLKKMNDTLYEFKFQPIVEFACNKRIGSGDSLGFSLTTRDTTISSLTYSVKVNNSIEFPVQLKLGWTTAYIKGADKGKFSINTKFIDPLTKKLIYLTVDTLSEPDLTYYGSKTVFGRIQISIINNKLTIYPDHKFIQDKDTFIWKQ
jgi:hypothetical protein